MSRGRSVRGGILAFLFGAEPRERERSGFHRSWKGDENTEEEEGGKDGPARGGGAGRGSSTDTVRGPMGRQVKNGGRDTRRKRRKDDKGCYRGTKQQS